jgi:uncharacterized membrane protein YidH (DUF202 family)
VYEKLGRESHHSPNRTTKETFKTKGDFRNRFTYNSFMELVKNLFSRNSPHAYGTIPPAESTNGVGTSTHAARTGMPTGVIDQAGNASSSLLRKVPIKVEPKVYFANERTFLAWMQMAVLLSSISVAIVAFAEANAWSQVYGLVLMPCSIAFCVYALWLYTKRASMIRRKDPGPYENKWGPIVLSVILAMSVITNFFVKLYEVNTR